MEHETLKPGDFVQTIDGWIVQITEINQDFINGIYYGIRGNPKGRIQMLSVRDFYKIEKPHWVKEQSKTMA